MFRYADKDVESRHTKDKGEFWIDFVKLRKIMAFYQEAFYFFVKELGNDSVEVK
jgi:hypothetical protein